MVIFWDGNISDVKLSDVNFLDFLSDSFRTLRALNIYLHIFRHQTFRMVKFLSENGTVQNIWQLM